MVSLQKYVNRTLIVAVVVQIVSVCSMADPHDLYIGWSHGDITPLESVALTGQLSKRISTHVENPLTATALAIETVGPEGQREQAIMVSCDLIWIRKDIQDRVRTTVASALPDFDLDKLVLSATHTHTGPGFKDDDFYGLYDVSNDPNVMSATEYGNFLVDRLALIVEQAWNNRAAGGLGIARGHAVTGHNRRVSYFDGSSTMYGLTNDEEFSHIEGYESHDLDLLFFYDSENTLTGMLINTAVPSQVDESETYISADFWHDVRQQIDAVYGSAVYVFPQCGAAGDQSLRPLIEQGIESLMRQRKGLTLRQEIARRIVNAVNDVCPLAPSQIHHYLEFEHTVTTMDLTVKNPPDQPFYKTDDPPVEIHCLRLGDVAIATVPFELYLDYGMRIKGRSQALLTFISQLSCQHVGYLPTARAVAGGGYSADSYIVGPQGGQELVDNIIEAVNLMFTAVAVESVQVIESENWTSVNEQSQTIDTYTVQLLTEPTQDVTITLTYDSGQLTVTPSSLLFTAANWNQPQTITVTAADDGLGEGTHTSIISHAADGGEYDDDVGIAPVVVTITEGVQSTNLIVNGDFEAPRVQELPPYWRGWPDNWTLASGNVIIDNEPSKWSQGPYNSPLGEQYLVGLPSGEFYQDVPTSFIANKTYSLDVDFGILAGRSNVDYFIELRDVQTNTVWAHIDQDDYGYPNPGYWDVTAELTYTTPPSGMPVGNQIRVFIGFKEAASGTFSNGICADNVELFISDAEPQTEQVLISESNELTQIDEYQQTSDTYDVELLTDPNEDVVIVLDYDNTQLTVNPQTLYFTTENWNQAQTITVTAIEDGAGEGSHITVISHSATGGNYDSIYIPSVVVAIEENYPLPPAVQVNETEGSTIINELGQLTDSYDIQLLAEPNELVAIALTYDSNQISIEPSGLLFDSGNWAQSQTVTVTAIKDGLDEGSHTTVISHTAFGGNYYGINIDSVTVIIEETIQLTNLIVNGDFELPRVQQLPPYWRGWPDGWTLASGEIIIDNEPTKWIQPPYNELLGNQYLVGLPSGEFYQDVAVSFIANKTYHLSVNLGTLIGKPDVDYFIELRDVQTNTVWAHVDQSNFGYPSAGLWDINAELTYAAPSVGSPVGNQIRVFIGFKEATSGAYGNGICADNVVLYVAD